VGTETKTPAEALDLQPGEPVIVKSLPEIVATLDARGRNRGLSFEPEMAAYCGRNFTVRQRVDRLIHETEGRMVPLQHTVTLATVACRCHYVFAGCRRSELQFWREIWLRRAPAPVDAPVRPRPSPARPASRRTTPSCTHST
jgi:hypothetical protein